VTEFWRIWGLRHGELPPTVPAIHGYFPGSTWQKYLDDYAELLTTHGWPEDTQIWIPEWNVPCPPGRTPEQQAPLFDAVAKMLDESELVAYHSPFALFVGPRYWPSLECVQLRDENGRLTPVGEIYKGNGGIAAYP
jgi:hypothetical protein